MKNEKTKKISLLELKQEVDSLSKIKDSFPIEVFPSAIQEIINETNDKLGYPKDFIASSILYTSSIAIGNRIQAQLKEDYNFCCNLYLSIVGHSGTCKSHPITWALRPILKIDRNLHSEYLINKRQFEEAILKSKSKDYEGVLPSEPKLKKHLVSDVTFEALAIVLNNNNVGIGLHRDELAGWFNNFDRYNKGSEIESWISIWSNKPISIDRKQNEPIFIENPFISVIGSIQLGIIKEMAKNNKGVNGFMERLLFVIPKDLKKLEWNRKSIDPRIAVLWDEIVNDIFSIKIDLDEFDMPKTKIVGFSNDAFEEIVNWQNSICKICDDYDDSKMSSLYSKVEQHAVKFALIIQVLESVCSGQELTKITTETVRKATSLAEYFANNSIKARELMELNHPISLDSELKKIVYNNLPVEFSTREGQSIAFNLGMSFRSFERFISCKDLFKKEKQGVYKKLHL